MKEFPPFRFDTANQCLWRSHGTGEDERILLAPKAFGVLQYLVEHANRLVTHSELIEALWPDSFVQPAVLSSHIRDVRSALGDNPKNPRFIETLARRGYRFIAAVSEGPTTGAVPIRPAKGKLVGRDLAIAQLQDRLHGMLHHQRQLVFITGEPGIGKTALVDEFQRRAAAEVTGLHIARGQCIEGYGGKEAYYPMLKALGELCDVGGDSIVQTLAMQAPTWLIQFPALLKPERRQLLQREIAGATAGRMLREIAEALDTITSETPLLLIFEDLHWVDYSTVDLISELARRQRPTGLLLVGTYRPVDATLSEHPINVLKQDLLVHQLCEEIPLEPLAERDIAEYLDTSAQTNLQDGLARLLHRHSEGNPLFMVAALDHMFERDVLFRENGELKLRIPLEEVDLQVPETLRQMVEVQIDRLKPQEQQALEAASIEGATFTCTSSAAATDTEPQHFEDLCENLARRDHVIRRLVAHQFPDGTISTRYQFLHVIYREVLYDRQAPGRRARSHRLIGERLEALYSGRVEEMAAELAHHFEEASDWVRTVKYLRLAARTAEQRYAHRESAGILRHTLELISRLPEAERAITELQVLERLATIYFVSSDMRCIETYEAVANRASAAGNIELEIRALLDWSYCWSSINADRSLELIERALGLIDALDDGVLSARAKMSCLAARIWFGGWRPRDAEEVRRMVPVIRQTSDRELLAPYLVDYSMIQWASSEYREAHQSVSGAIEILAQQRTEFLYLSLAYQKSEIYIPRSLHFLGEWGEALRQIDDAITAADRNGDQFATQFLRSIRAWIQLHAMDFAGVLRTCRSMVALTGNFTGDYLDRISRIFAGCAEAGLGNYDRALDELLGARDQMNSQKIMMDWYYRMPLELGLTEVWLGKKDLIRARQEAERFLNSALATAERTWQALAWEVNARVAMAEIDLKRAQCCVSRALETMEGFEIPLAGWRVHATAAEVSQCAEDIESSQRHREISRVAILKLANSLAPEDPLRKTFLSALSATKVLAEPVEGVIFQTPLQ
jgi:DNA-binding winged helix-turn-helix (wHTH) protein/tetratricopeptide (TPR) repeat protein